MKKLLICLLLCCVLCLCLGLPALAVEAPAEQLTAEEIVQPSKEEIAQPSSSQRRLDYVTDQAGLLSVTQLQSLNASAKAVSEQYSCGVYIVVLKDFREFSSGSIEQCTEDLYHYFDLGYGDSRDGILLVMSMAERDYDLWGYGPYAQYAFTEYALDGMEESFLPYFRENNWNGGFSAYIRGCTRALEAAALGEPLAYKMPMSLKAAISLGPAAVIGFLVCGVFKSQMKTAKEKDSADEYVVKGSSRLRVKTDQFINTTRTVQVIESNSGGSRGGGSIGGTSHHSGKF